LSSYFLSCFDEGVFRLIFILPKTSLDFFTYLWKTVGMERLVGKYIFGLKISAGKTIFLTSPRQVGKTTFARNWLFSERVEDTHFDCAKW
jgi:hypothetical protein